MAVEKGKVLTAIDAKFKGKSLSKNFKDSLATKWAAKIETDEDIDAYIEDREDVILEASTEADRRATQAAKKAKEEAAAAVTGKKDDNEDEEPIDDPTMPAWAKAMMNQNKALAEEISSFKQSRQAETLADRFHKDPRLKDVPEFVRKRAIPTKEEDFESAVTELHTEYSKFATDNKLQAFGGDTPPSGGNKGGSGGASAGKVDPDIVSFGKKQNEAVTKKDN